MILAVEATRSIRQAKLGATRTDAGTGSGSPPERPAADKAYGLGEMLDWLVDEQNIEPHIPVIDESERPDGTFSNAEFTFDAGADEYICGGGKHLKKYRRKMTKPRTGISKDGFRQYYGNKQDCASVP